MKKKLVFAAAAAVVLTITSCTYFAESPPEDRTDVSAESIELSNTQLNIYVGETKNVGVSLYPQTTSDEAAFASDNEEVAVVDASGAVTGKSTGTATVYVKAGLLSASCRVTVVNPPAERIYADVSSLELKVGEKFKLSVSIYPEGAGASEIVYFSDDDRIATVDENGIVTAVGFGLTSIGMYIKGSSHVRAIVEVSTLCESIASLKFDEFYYAVPKDGIITPDITIEPFGMSADKIKYASSDESVAVVDENGVVHGIEYGMTTVTAETEDGVSAECRVAVTNRMPPERVYASPEPEYKLNAEGVYARQSGRDDGQALIMLAGGISADASQQRVAKRGTSYDFSDSFEYLRAAFSRGDFSAAAFYSTLSYSAKYASENGRGFNASPSMLEAVRYAGIDGVAAAGEYGLAAGKQGLYETVQQLERYGIAETGLFASEDEQRGFIADVNGIKVGFLSYTDVVSGAPEMIPSERADLLNIYSDEAVCEDVKSLREAGAEFIIAYIDWGDVSYPGVTKRQRERAYAMAEAGVGLIAGTNRNGLREAEYIDTQEGGRALAVYSLGNLVSGGDGAEDRDSIILCAGIEKQGGKAVLSDVSFIPLRLIGSYRGGRYVTVPAVAGINGGEMTVSLQSARERIAELYEGVLSEAEF